MANTLKAGVLGVVLGGLASSSTLAACLEQPSRYVLTCQQACCASLTTACANGGAKYTPTKGGGGKCTVGSTGKIGSIKSNASVAIAPVAPATNLKAN